MYSMMMTGTAMPRSWLKTSCCSCTKGRGQRVKRSVNGNLPTCCRDADVTAGSSAGDAAAANKRATIKVNRFYILRTKQKLSFVRLWSEQLLHICSQHVVNAVVAVYGGSSHTPLKAQQLPSRCKGTRRSRSWRRMR